MTEIVYSQSQGNLLLVLSALMFLPFEPLSTYDLPFLSYKEAFLLAITTAQRVEELRGLCFSLPFTRFYADKVVLHPSLYFLLKILSTFHISQGILVFSSSSSNGEQTLHTLDVHRTFTVLFI